MSNCDSCNKNCGGCDQSLTLTEAEVSVLEALSQIPFLPIARKVDDPSPIYLEENRYSVEEYALILQCLEKKGLISLDFDRPLKNAAPSAYPIQGSMALTARGQAVIELMDLQGVEE